MIIQAAAQWLNRSTRTIANVLEFDYLIHMTKTANRSPSKATSRSSKMPVRSPSNGRFLSVASLKPVTKRATITSAQADKAVKDYLDSHPQ